jgi:excisionase family DNA binding protein
MTTRTKALLLDHDERAATQLPMPTGTGNSGPRGRTGQSESEPAYAHSNHQVRSGPSLHWCGRFAMATQSAADELLTTWGVADLLSVNRKTVNRWAQAGKLDFTLAPGGHRRFLRADVLAIRALAYQRLDYAKRCTLRYRNLRVGTL